MKAGWGGDDKKNCNKGYWEYKIKKKYFVTKEIGQI